jgi:hypothetical protein
VGTDQPYCADHKDENHGQHDGVLSDVLTFIVRTELGEERSHNHFLVVRDLLIARAR